MTELEKARLYEEEHWADIPPEERPGFHLTPYVGWLNDPNGFSRYKGEYHLFYQYHPYSTQWASMHWGHVRSADLIHWEYLPAALAPDKEYDRSGCFSGSAVQMPDGRHMIVYTGVNGPKQTQCVAFGDGMNYVKSPMNPVISPKDIPGGCYQDDFRDPKVWREKDGWYLVVATRDPEHGGAAQMFRSEDGVRWDWEALLDASYGKLGRMWECPDFFPLGNKQVLTVSCIDLKAEEGPVYQEGNRTIALIGRYDHDTRSFEREKVQPMDYGPDFYAPQTLGTREGRRLLIGWLQDPRAGSLQPEGIHCYGTLSIPRELSMKDGVLCQWPVRELESYRSGMISCNSFYLNGRLTMNGLSGRQVDMEISFRPDGDCQSFRVVFAADREHGTQLIWERKTGLLTLDRSHSGLVEGMKESCSVPVTLREKTLKLRVLIDHSAVEVFAEEGRKVLSALIHTPLSADGILFASQGTGLLDFRKYDIVT